MTIRRLLKNSSLPPEEVGRFVTAYQQTLRALYLADRHDPVAEIVAKKVIEIGKGGGDQSKSQNLRSTSLLSDKEHHARAILRAGTALSLPSGCQSVKRI
jgi:hypothetical protein